MATGATRAEGALMSTETPPPDNTQLICTTEPVCLCAGEEFSCDCTEDADGGQCTGCEAPMKRINSDTGEDVDG